MTRIAEFYTRRWSSSYAHIIRRKQILIERDVNCVRVLEKASLKETEMFQVARLLTQKFKPQLTCISGGSKGGLGVAAKDCTMFMKR